MPEDDELPTAPPEQAPLPTAPPPDAVADPTTGAVIPPVAIPQGIGTLGASLAKTYDIPTSPVADAPLVDMQPGHADRMAAAQNMQPGAADGGGSLYPNENPPGVTVMRPGTPGGMQVQGETIEKVPDKAAKALTAQGDAVAGAKREADAATAGGQQAYADAINKQANDLYQTAQAGDLATAAAIARNQMVQARVKDKMDDVANFKPDRQQIFEGTAGGFRALGAAIGMIFGGALSGLTGQKNQAQEAVFKMIDDNVRDQVRQNSQAYDQLKQRLGDDQAAELALRQKHLEYAKQIFDAQALGRQGQAMNANLAGAAQRTELEIQNAKLALQERLLPHEKLALAHVAPTPTQILTLDRQEQMLKQYGVAPEARQKFMLQKVDEKNTVNDLIEGVKGDTRDLNNLQAIRDAYGGNLPGKGQAIDWTRSHTLRALGARLGFTKAVDASAVYAQLEKSALERARGYGRITEPEIESSRLQMGETPDQIAAFMQDNIDHAQHRLSGVANAYFGDNGQPVLDIMAKGIAGTPGVRTAGITPR